MCALRLREVERSRLGDHRALSRRHLNCVVVLPEPHSAAGRNDYPQARVVIPANIRRRAGVGDAIGPEADQLVARVVLGPGGAVERRGIGEPELERALIPADVLGPEIRGLTGRDRGGVDLLDAIRLGYRTAVLTDLCAPVNLQPGDGARAEQTMRDAGVQMWQTRMR